MVHESLMAAKELEKEGISTTVANLHTIKPIDESLIIDIVKTHKKILVCEDHQVTGGLFSAVAEVVVRNHPVILERIGVENCFGQSGSPQELLDFYELSAKCIAQKAKAIVRQ